MPCNHKVAAAARVQGELFLEIRHGEVAVGRLTKHSLPLLANSGDAHPQECGGSRIGKRHQMLSHLVVIKEDDVACCLLHLVTLF